MPKLAKPVSYTHLDVYKRQVDTHAANDVDDHDAEGETGDGVHRAVALNERGKEGTVLIGLCLLYTSICW